MKAVNNTLAETIETALKRTLFPAVFGIAFFAGWPAKTQAAALYVSQFTNSVIQFDTPNMGAGNTTFTAGGVNLPFGLAFGPGGNLYVSNYPGNSISYYDPSGTFISSVSGGMNGPVGIAFDGVNNLYVVNQTGAYVSTYDTSGNFLTSFGNINLSQPSSVTFDSAGNIYVTNTQTGVNSITKFDSAGGYLATISDPSFSRPADLTFDLAGNFYVANLANNTISKLDSSGTFIATIGSSSNLNSPQSVLVDSAGNIYVSNSGNNSITVFNSSGSFSGNYATSNTPTYMTFAVPEPSAYFMAIVGLCALCVSGRFRTASRKH